MADPHQPHFDRAPPELHDPLRAIQAEVERRVPDATRDIGYRMPAFRQRKIFFYFSAFKKHVGVYPPVHGPTDLVERLGPYQGPKGNLLFPHKDPLPLDLIGEVAEALAAQYADAQTP